MLHYILDTVDQRDRNTSWQVTLTKILDSRPELLDSQDLFGRTPLYTVCENGQFKAVADLIARKADVHISTSLGLTPLHITAASGHTLICNLLLRRSKSDINSADKVNTWTPLFYAARHGHYDVVQLLLDHKGVDVNHRDCREHTPLHLATRGRHLGVLKLLGSHDRVVQDVLDYQVVPLSTMQGTRNLWMGSSIFLKYFDWIPTAKMKKERHHSCLQ